MNWNSELIKWKSCSNLDFELKKELDALTKDPSILEDSFYKNLEFGTGGMRGIMGPGTNRLNIYTIRKVSHGIGIYIDEKGEDAKQQGAVIAYDSRYNSERFALEAALTLGRLGIKTYLFDSLRPTPLLSFAVRHLHAYTGIMITASHNPPEYNGIKVYGSDGCQLSPANSNIIIEKINKVENELEIEVANEMELKDSGRLKVIGIEIDKAYIERVKSICINPEVIKKMHHLSIVYTPLHGAGNRIVQQGLKEVGFTNITMVKEQEIPDPKFSTVNAPNPEDPTVFELAIEYGKRIGADVILATDPDADRVGVAVKNNQNEYVFLTGNQVGALLLHYILTQRQKQGLLNDNGIVLKTIVTSELGKSIASDFGIETTDTLTGFKYIGEKIREYENSDQYHFLFGYEESYGYLIGDFVRDKDGVQACLMIAEAASYYKNQSQTLCEVLIAIYEKYGYYYETIESVTLKGKTGIGQIKSIVTFFRENPPAQITGKSIFIIEDFLINRRIYTQSGKQETIHLPSSDVLKFTLNDDSWICIRPSGTEPKVKVYFGVKYNTLQESQEHLYTLKTEFMNMVQQIIDHPLNKELE